MALFWLRVYPTEEVLGFFFSLEKTHGGEIVGLLGLNGAGKTTVLRCIAGIIRLTGGQVVIDGHDLSRSEISAKRALAFVLETPDPYEMLTVSEHLQFIALAYCYPGWSAAFGMTIEIRGNLKRINILKAIPIPDGQAVFALVLTPAFRVSLLFWMNALAMYWLLPDISSDLLRLCVFLFPSAVPQWPPLWPWA